ncbi:primosomal protein N' [Marinicella sp. S1101]|uniref:primosomal protein N' n=1 Tax=Marinicella marina TaxID=2996016 RepID=UPI002260D8C6|nr:primosomal protein N' [Marinicella marina]MCX7554219.1 primosomal protein N' [Marinicella marina]MDJ1138788.1 primosomal protein N' [Marinicella marina]
MQKPSKNTVLQVALKVPFAPYLDYLLPEGLQAPEAGVRVLVPLGKNKRLVGLVIGHSDQSEHKNLKPILEVLDQQALLDKHTLEVLQQAAKYYQVNLGEMIFTALPAWYRRIENRPIPHQFWWRAKGEIEPAKTLLKNAKKQQEIFEYLHKHGPLQSKTMSHISASAAQICRQLQQKGLVDCAEVCFLENDSVKDPGFQLTADQATALGQIQAQSDQFQVHLLDGVTGSGKTEIYIRLINDLLAQNKQALVLVPEIGLTPQLFQEISQRINGQMAILHSGLSDGARARVWQHAAKGLVDVVVSTRSGIFTPFKNLGSILVDEEHDLSYKQQEGVRYSARDLAILRGKIQQIPVVLGSATPSFETLNHAISGKYQWLKLRTRTNQNPMPSLTLQNTQSKHFIKGLTAKTIDAIDVHLAAGNQVLVFLNRRGWSHKLICHDCGWVAECDDCDAYLTYHKHLDLLKCHHCERRYSLPEFCPQCGSQEVETMGVGTEKLADGLAERFHDFAVVRFDRDAVKTPAQWQKNLEVVRSGQPCVIVGTQMLSKGHDFPLLSLVVVVNVDNSFFSTDFRATEYLAQLLVQVSGRAGRAKTKGEVIIQTQFPEHEFFQMLFKANYQTFAQQQLLERDAMRFPPYTHMAIIRGQHRSERVLDEFLQKLANGMQQSEDISVMGPLPAPMQKRQKLYRMQLILNSNDRRSLHQTIYQLKQLPLAQGEQQIPWFVDIDPVNFD